MLLKSLLTRVEREPVAEPVRERFGRHWQLLEQAEAHDARAVRETLDYPSVGVWLAGALAACEGEEFAGWLEHFGGVVGAAVLRAGFPCELVLPVFGGRLTLPGVGAVRTGAGAVRLRVGPRVVRPARVGSFPYPPLPAASICGSAAWGLRPRPSGPAEAGGSGAEPPISGRGGEGKQTPGARNPRGTGTDWLALRRLPGSGAYLDDLDPYRAPSTGVGAAALPAAPRERVRSEPWVGRWREAVGLLRGVDARRADEVTALLRALVPLDQPAQGAPRVSATFRAAPGAVLAALPETAADLAAVLVHETQHSKLSLLHDLLPLHAAGPEAVHRVAWRADPRPFEGVLQGTYAHLGLADFWARAATGPALPAGARDAARTRRDSYCRQVAEALRILLESNELTAAGREFALGMAGHLATLDGAAGA
ncbi:HEXXH motif-containing putative peptide modification protein [Streptomyces gamaensis]|uniref:HEXXH motif-containing putative peptide modification protein n=1 Tax=Streptomyces gamaensis TaxID=1763542 RepID=A0ABW0ZA11_9ACTN